MPGRVTLAPLLSRPCAGMIPMPEWTSVSAFANPSATVVLRQKNAGICGEPPAVVSGMESDSKPSPLPLSRQPFGSMCGPGCGELPALF